MTQPEVLAAAAAILLQGYLVWPSAPQRYGRPRQALALCLIVAIFSLVRTIAQRGLEFSRA